MANTYGSGGYARLAKGYAPICATRIARADTLCGHWGDAARSNMRYAHAAGAYIAPTLGHAAWSNMRYAHTAGVIHCADGGGMPRGHNMRYAHAAGGYIAPTDGGMPRSGAGL